MINLTKQQSSQICNQTIIDIYISSCDWSKVVKFDNNIALQLIIIAGMLSSLRLNTVTYIGREEQKKLTLIITFLIELPDAHQFIHPVDWQQLQLNDYPLIVKHPMNLLKIQDKLKAREYRTVEEVLDHIQLVWDNCKAYNPEGHYYVLADKLERQFKKMIRNYLPNIQVVVPKPINSTGGHHQPPQKQKPQIISQPKANTRPEKKVSMPVSYANFQSVKESYDEPQSANDHPGDLGQIEDIPLSQKNRLHQRLKQLTQQQLAQIIFIIQQNCGQGFKELGGGRCQLLLDNMDIETFKKVNLKIDDLLEGEKASGSKKVKV